MQIHIWQQFFSNHSSDFVVVGKFRSEESAIVAAEKLSEMFEAIHEWRKSTDDEYRKYVISLPDNQIPPTEPEIRFGQEYGVEWPVGLFGMDILHYRDLVILRNTYEKWQGPQPIDQILAKLGADVALDLEGIGGYSSILSTITFSVLQKSTADELEAHFERIFQRLHVEMDEIEAPQIPIGFWYNLDCLRDNLKYYELERNNLDFVLHGIEFGDWLEVGLQAVIDYLVARDCYDINYHFQTFWH